MKKQFKISVPKPCHEDWSKMTPKEKGRFCQSCSKTVVDFTLKSKEEIQEYLSKNFGNRVCGHFRREQLDTVTLELPASAFHQNLSFQKLFLLVLLIVMGTTLFSCQDSNGKKQKIEDVILIDSVLPKNLHIVDDVIRKETKKVDSLHEQDCTQGKDTTGHYMNGNLPLIPQPNFPPPQLTGIVVIDSDLKTKEQIEEEKKKREGYYILGSTRFTNSEIFAKTTFMNHDINWTDPVHIDDIIEIEEEEEIIEDVPSIDARTNASKEANLDILGDVISEAEEVEEIDIVLGYIIEQPPKFSGSDSLTGERAREDFNKKIQLFFDQHFEVPEENLYLKKERYRIYAQFEIDTLGQVQDIKIKAPHPLLAKETERVLQKLPTFIPGEQRGKALNTRYTLPLFIDLRD